MSRVPRSHDWIYDHETRSYKPDNFYEHPFEIFEDSLNGYAIVYDGLGLHGGHTAHRSTYELAVDYAEFHMNLFEERIGGEGE